MKKSGKQIVMGNWRLRQMRDKNETYQCAKNKIIIAETERLLETIGDMVMLLRATRL